MKMTVWMAQNRSGDFLCMGNGNEGLSYHFSYPADCEYLRSEDYIICRTKWETEEHIRRWHGEYPRALDTYSRSLERRFLLCRPVRMAVSWKPVKETKKGAGDGK